jgi:hypothetical protein
MWNASRRGELFIGVLLGRPESKISVGKPRPRWKTTLRWTLMR